ncbi:RDD family protein [Citricoccus alkalitolerans]|uniref:RDD family protein n=1 Tax=Citricoccus alkalitolerans TaxID=246603 RepID=A0ABV8Y212_9MICC
MARTPQIPPSSGDDPAAGSRRRDSGRHPDEPLVTRRDMAGWVGGTARPNTQGRWPGERLGLAQDGPTSMAGWGRRILALLIDWFIAMIVSSVWFEGNPLVTHGIFALMHVLMLSLFGTTVGKRVARIQVVRLGGAMANLFRVTLRTVLLCLVVPPALIDPDGRGLHDRLAGTVEIRM